MDFRFTFLVHFSTLTKVSGREGGRLTAGGVPERTVSLQL